MTDTQVQQIQVLINDDTNPFSKAVYESFLKNTKKEQTQQPVLLDIIRSLFVILGREVILKSPIKYSVEAFVNVYNILFPGEFKLIRYLPTYFSKEEVDGDTNLFFNETICIGGNGLYYLCNNKLEPKDRGYETLESLIKAHGI